MTKKTSLITIANEQVDILYVCRLAGLNIPEVVGKSYKTHCPFGSIYHSDGGIGPAFNVYPSSNSAYCFACNTLYTPAKLAALIWDTTTKQAAAELLDRINYKPISLAKAWENLEEYKNKAPDKPSLSQALWLYCARIDRNWNTRQFEFGVSDKLDKCLALLEKVNSDEDAELWLATTKQIMQAVLKSPAK